MKTKIMKAICLCLALVLCFGSTISGALFDASGSYNSTFFLIIGLAAAGIVCSLAISVLDKKQK
mgnify:CR=1 FL=1